MGLREMKVARTRAQVVDVALDLFLEQGYDATTMEQIAEVAEIGTTTLYRYFPSKELLALDPFVRVLDLARLLEERPDDEPLAESLGAVVRDSYPGNVIEKSRLLELRHLVDVNPGPRARLWDFVNTATGDFERAVARRMGRPVGDPSVALTAATVFAVRGIVSRSWTKGYTRESWDKTVDRTLAALAPHDVILPR